MSNSDMGNEELLFRTPSKVSTSFEAQKLSFLIPLLLAEKQAYKSDPVADSK